MRIMHTADLHLHPEHPERREALEKICQMAQEHECSALLIAGDLFDQAEVALNERPKLRELFDRYPFDVFIVAGNHDERCYDFHFDYGQRVHLAGQKGLVRWQTKEGVEIWGLPFHRGRQAGEYLASQTPDPQTPTVLLTHASFYHADSHWVAICRGLQEHAEEEAGGDFSLFARDLHGKGFSYVALGHWHNPTDPPLQINRTVAAYAGSPCAVAADELGRRQVVLVELEGNKTNVQFLPLEGLPYYVAERFFAVPGGEEQTLNQVAEFLQTKADPLAKAKLRVEGFLEWDEGKFRAELENVRSQYAARWRHVEFQHSWSKLPDAPTGLVRSFIDQINANTGQQLQSLLNEFEPGVLWETASQWLQEAQEELKQEAISLGLQAMHEQRLRNRR